MKRGLNSLRFAAVDLFPEPRTKMEPSPVPVSPSGMVVIKEGKAAEGAELTVLPPGIQSSSNAGAGGAPKTSKRTDALDWDTYFMALALLSAQRSKDPSTQVGAVIVDEEKRILSVGYNGFPRGVSDDDFSWAREGDPLDTKYPFVVHAEANAVLNRNTASLKGATLYVGLFPCNECAKLLLQSGIREIVFASDKYHDSMPMTASRRMLDAAGVKYRQFTPPMDRIVLEFNSDKKA